MNYTMMYVSKYTAQLTLLAFLVCSAVVNSSGQSFAFVESNPFNINPEFGNNLPNKLDIVDWDHDGDLDILVHQLNLSEVGDTLNIFDFQYVSTYFENTGTENSPTYSTGTTVFDELELPDGFFFPVAGDMNNDMETDLLAMGDIDYASNVQRLRVYIQEGRSMAGFVSFGADSLGVDECAPYSWLFPELADLDLDGDLDILMSGTSTSVFDNSEDLRVCLMSRNEGTPETPLFTEWFFNPFNSKPDTSLETIQTGDLDNDGDIDLLGLGNFEGTLQFFFHENVATGNIAMQFLDPVLDPFGLPSGTEDRTFLASDLADLDGDGDLDLFVVVLDDGEISIEYYGNSLCSSITAEVEATICEGDSYSVGDSEFDKAGDYTINLERTNGCDSIVELRLSLYPSTLETTSAEICEGEVVILHEQEFSQPGVYQVGFVNQFGCDSIIEVEISVLPHSPYTEATTICEGETYTIAGMEFDKEGTYEFVIQAQNGCDSNITLELTVIPDIINEINVGICSGDSYEVGDESFSESGTYEIQLSNNECDSTVILTLEVADTIRTELFPDLCVGETFTLGDLEIETSGTYEYTFSSVSGCDSIVTAEVVFHEVDDSVTVEEDRLISVANGAEYQWIDCATEDDIDGATEAIFSPTQSGSYKVRVTNAFGCVATSSCVEFVISSTNIPEWASDIKIFPNPASDFLTVKTNGITLDEVWLIAASGHQYWLPVQQLERIPISQYPAGVYFVRLMVDNAYHVEKLVISNNR